MLFINYIFIALLINQILCLGQNQVIKFKRDIITGMNITKSLSISQFGQLFIIGSWKGQLKVFNYQTGQQSSYIKQGDMAIIQTVWIKDRNGLITISSDEQRNESLAIIRDRYIYEQVYRWQFNSCIYSVDYTYTQWQSYVSYNFGNMIKEYDLKLQNITNIYYNYAGRKYIQHSYSSNYSYLYLISKDNILPQRFYYIHHWPCNQRYEWYYPTNLIVSNLQADKYSTVDNPMIFKQTNLITNQTKFMSQDYQLINSYTFPSDKNISYFKYCPQKYILAITQQQQIIFYSRDYQFSLLANIDYFMSQNINILQVQCKNNHVIVSGENNIVYVYQLTPFQVQQQTDWLKISMFIGLGVIILLIVIVITCKKIKQHHLLQKAKLHQQLLNNSHQSINIESIQQ